MMITNEKIIKLKIPSEYRRPLLLLSTFSREAAVVEKNYEPADVGVGDERREPAAAAAVDDDDDDVVVAAAPERWETKNLPL